MACGSDQGSNGKDWTILFGTKIKNVMARYEAPATRMGSRGEDFPLVRRLQSLPAAAQ